VRHCLSKLEPFMAPKRVQFLAELPKTHNGKIKKLGLQTLGATEEGTEASRC